MRRVLIIDDEADMREVSRASLEDTVGWDVYTADGGAEGVRLALELQPEAILLDVMMPEMDGAATLRALRARPETARIPVLLLTARSQADDLERFADQEVDAVLTKPFDPFKLAGEIARALGWNP